MAQNIADVMLIIGAIAIPALAYAGDFAGFRTWINSMGQGAAGAPVPGTGRTPNPFAPATDNRCFPASSASPITKGKLYCQCAGSSRPWLMGINRTCSTCEAECRAGRIPTEAAFARSYATYPMKGLIVA